MPTAQQHGLLTKFEPRLTGTRSDEPNQGVPLHSAPHTKPDAKQDRQRWDSWIESGDPNPCCRDHNHSDVSNLVYLPQPLRFLHLDCTLLEVWRFLRNRHLSARGKHKTPCVAVARTNEDGRDWFPEHRLVSEMAVLISGSRSGLSGLPSQLRLGVMCCRRSAGRSAAGSIDSRWD